jgi:hypothetical protein
MDALTIDYVFQSVILATLKSSNKRALRDAYDQILDDLDDNKDITFAPIQTICARQFQCTKERHPDPPHSADTPRATPRPSLAKPEDYSRQGGNDLAAFLCNTLEQHGKQTGKVLRRARLAGAEWSEPASVTLFMTDQKHLMMMTFICSCRNNNQTTAIYPLGTFPRGLKKAHVMMLPSCPLWYYDDPFTPLVDVVVR